MRWRAEVSRLMVPVAAPAARRASWYWRIWYVVSAAARPARPKQAARWAVRPRAVLTDRNCRTPVVLEVRVDEISQASALGSRTCAAAMPSRRGCRGGLAESCRVGPWTRVSFPAATGGGRRSTFALAGRTGKWNVRRRTDGDVTGEARARWSGELIDLAPRSRRVVARILTGPHDANRQDSHPPDAIRHWSAEGGHPIEDFAAKDDLTPLPGWAPGAKAISDDGFVSEERILHPALTMVP